MYKIIGGDKKEYGPVEAELLRRWYAEGRVNGQTLVQAVGSTDWRPLETFPELVSITSPELPPLQSNVPPAWDSTIGTSTALSDHDYDLDISGCIGSAWNLLRANFGLLFGGVLIFMLVQGGLSLMAQIPILGILIWLASIILGGPFRGGLFYFLLRVVRREPAEVGDIFAGFKINFGQLILVFIVKGLLTLAAAAPGIILCIIGGFMIEHAHEPAPLSITLLAIGGLLALIPLIYFGVSWFFAVPLVIDKRLDFWPALGYSRKMVSKHWWSVFGLIVVTGLINLAGICACCIGFFVTAPGVLTAWACAYEKIFNAPSPSTSFTP
jgi:hypothetical protein